MACLPPLFALCLPFFSTTTKLAHKSAIADEFVFGLGRAFWRGFFVESKGRSPLRPALADFILKIQNFAVCFGTLRTASPTGFGTDLFLQKIALRDPQIHAVRNGLKHGRACADIAFVLFRAAEHREVFADFLRAVLVVADG